MCYLHEYMKYLQKKGVQQLNGTVTHSHAKRRSFGDALREPLVVHLALVTRHTGRWPSVSCTSALGPLQEN
jgi:hypothetical protein